MSKIYTATHRYEYLTEDNRPQDHTLDGSTLKFETLEHGGAAPDSMPNAIKITDTEGRSLTYVPITHLGEQVKSLGYDGRREVS